LPPCFVAPNPPTIIDPVLADASRRERSSSALFNEGVAAVLFALVLTWVQATDGAITTAVVARELALMAGGGVFVGIAAGGAAIVLAGRTSDHLVETALTVVAAYGSFLLAEYFHFSGNAQHRSRSRAVPSVPRGIVTLAKKRRLLSRFGSAISALKH
jgi:NhaP-type Na+/H+ or K+/H+ antiporter